MTALLLQLVREENGQDLIEYALLAGFISLAAVAAITTLGDSLTDVYNNINEKVGQAAGDAGGAQQP